MKNVKLIFVLLLMVNCTTDSSEVLETQDDFGPQMLSCVDDLPQVKITNNGTLTFDIAVYGQDYSELHAENLDTTAESDWLELSSNDIFIVASNDDVDGQKIQLNIFPCESVEVEVDENNILLISGE
ncbi:alpha-crystallin domain-containing protein [Winogradskyella thalassocola]|uniref:Uncharacterized protein n=1 Tax=Winogradskyella thalassocola TaxID=262004 RepID=A0A1G7YEG9_9FLAO|nr:hypothetical protein [Winogradskyella thalassocola]SDG94881.1 hypothetical protein SAMN04489796_1011007 [Winogradskyella thalassocola]